jgi:hypothetical protein
MSSMQTKKIKQKKYQHDPATPNAPGKRKKNQIMGIALRAIATASVPL